MSDDGEHSGFGSDDEQKVDSQQNLNLDDLQSDKPAEVETKHVEEEAGFCHSQAHKQQDITDLESQYDENDGSEDSSLDGEDDNEIENNRGSTAEKTREQKTQEAVRRWLDQKQLELQVRRLKQLQVNDVGTNICV
jgi:hypothetical protein